MSQQVSYHAHPTAVIDEPVEIGEKTRIWHFSHIMKDVHIGRECVLGQNCFIASEVTIGDSCHLQNNVSVYYGVTLEDHVFVGPSAVFTNDLNPRPFHHKDAAEYPKTLIRVGASIGANATVVAGVTMGEHSFLGAGSVLTRDLPAHAIAAGNPARLKGYMCRCGARLALPVFYARLSGRELMGEAPEAHQPPDECQVICPECKAVVAMRGGIVGLE